MIESVLKLARVSMKGDPLERLELEDDHELGVVERPGVAPRAPQARHADARRLRCAARRGGARIARDDHVGLARLQSADPVNESGPSKINCFLRSSLNERVVH